MWLLYFHGYKAHIIYIFFLQLTGHLCIMPVSMISTNIWTGCRSLWVKTVWPMVFQWTIEKKNTENEIKVGK